MNLIDCFRPALVGRAHEIALVHAGDRWSFGAIDRASNQARWSWLESRGVALGDRVALLLPNSIEFVLAYLACLKSGAVAIPLNPAFRERELRGILADAEPEVLITDREHRKELGASVPQRTQVVVVDDLPGIDEGADQDSASSAVRVVGSDPALFVYTSGTTGRPKGAVLTHDNLASNLLALLHCWEWTSADRLLLSLPLSHLHGLGLGLHGWLAAGCETHLLRRFDAGQILTTAAESNATLFLGVPTMYERLITAARAGAPIPDSVRLWACGSAPLSTSTFERFEATFGHSILVRYGMSETSMITTQLASEPAGRVPGSVGKPLPGVSVRIVDRAGDEVERGEVGEIQVSGPNVMQGYWRRDEETRQAFTADGWFKTGDLGRFDEAGHLRLTGRLKDLIITGGHNVHPQEVADCLIEHELVDDAAVVGALDRDYGERVQAFVVRREASVSADELLDHCRRRLAAFKVPKDLEFVAELPRNALGKLDRSSLPDLSQAKPT